MRIWRYQLEITDRQTLQLPLGYELLSAAPGCQYGINLWVRVPEEAPLVDVDFDVIGTGNLMPQVRLVYIDTVVMPDGLGVWHVFERPDVMQKPRR